jgi:hypothetical protein
LKKAFRAIDQNTLAQINCRFARDCAVVTRNFVMKIILLIPMDCLPPFRPYGSPLSTAMFAGRFEARKAGANDNDIVKQATGSSPAAPTSSAIFGLA